MTTPIGTPSDGYSKFLWVPGQGTISNPAAPTATELLGGTVKNFSLYMTEFSPNLSENTAATQRINIVNTPTRPGRAQRTIATGYVYNPQVPASNDAADSLTEFLIGYWIDRVGFPHAQAIAADDVVDVYLVHLGRQNRTRAAETDILVMQTAFVLDYWQSVTVVA